MREIKFRAIIDGEVSYEVTGFECDPCGSICGVFVDGDFFIVEDHPYHSYASKTIHKSASIEQYTGLKDKNGVEIYEGDIIPYGRKNYEVVYDGPYFTLNNYVIIDYYGHDAPELKDWSEFEVIGNIRQNPELLEK